MFCQTTGAKHSSMVVVEGVTIALERKAYKITTIYDDHVRKRKITIHEQ